MTVLSTLRVKRISKASITTQSIASLFLNTSLGIFAIGTTFVFFKEKLSIEIFEDVDIATISLSVLFLELVALLIYLTSSKVDFIGLSLFSILILSAAVPFIQRQILIDNTVRTWVVAHLIVALPVLMWRLIRLRTISLFLFLTSTISLVTIWFGYKAFSIDEKSLLSLGRLTGIFGHPNITGASAALLVLLLVSNKKINTLPFFTACALMLASLSTTSILALTASLIVLKISSPKIKLLVFWLSMFSLFIPLLLISFKIPVDTSLFTGRVKIWEWLSNYKVDFLNGSGLGLFETLHRSGQIPWVHTHNDLLMELTTGGLFAGITFILTVALLGFISLRSETNLSFAAWVFLVVTCFSEIPIFLDYPGGRTLFAIVSILLILISAKQRKIEQIYLGTPK